MTRHNERIVVGVLGLMSAAISLFIGLHFLANSGSSEIAVTTGDSGSAAAPAALDPSAQSPAVDGTDGIDVTSTSVANTVQQPKESSTTTVATTAPTTSTSTTTTEPTSTTASPTTETTLATTTTEESTTTTSEPASSSTSSTTAPSTTTTTTVETTTTTAATTTSAPAAVITELEREILQLTNELRTDPAGRLRRQGVTPECVHDNDHIEFDPETGHPKPVPALRLSELVSIQMARDWSQQMADADAMSHRSNESQIVIYEGLGIDWAARGENVAWAVGYSPNTIAQLFFNGWRESAGHYCNMMSSAFTHIGIGHIRTDAGKDFATQNLYRPR